MRKLFLLVLLISARAGAQNEIEKFHKTVRDFHQAMVNKDWIFLRDHCTSALTYGHSNGWVESSTQFGTNIATGYIVYHSFKEDSLDALVDKKMAQIRFVADIDVTLNGKRGLYHLKVLEVWRKRGKHWLLYARQAVK